LKKLTVVLLSANVMNPVQYYSRPQRVDRDSWIFRKSIPFFTTSWFTHACRA